MKSNQIDNTPILDLFRKYESQIFDQFEKVILERGYSIGQLDKVGILDEMFCKMSDEDFLNDLLTNIEDSIGVEQYGIEEE